MNRSPNELPGDQDLTRIRLLLTDVDGVLTDGRIHFDAAGNEVKSFHVHDAAGVFYWQRAGGLTGFVSGRRGRISRARVRSLIWSIEWSILMSVNGISLAPVAASPSAKPCTVWW